MANVGIAGLNLHVFAHISDIGYPSFIAATVMSIIAFTQLGSTMFWGFISERVEIRKATTLMFLIQAAGIGVAVAGTQLLSIYVGFFLYGIGLGGSLVLQEMIWATYYGRYAISFVLFAVALLICAFLTLLARAPQKRNPIYAEA
jgi:MFS family permease